MSKASNYVPKVHGTTGARGVCPDCHHNEVQRKQWGKEPFWNCGWCGAVWTQKPEPPQ